MSDLNPIDDVHLYALAAEGALPPWKCKRDGLRGLGLEIIRLRMRNYALERTRKILLHRLEAVGVERTNPLEPME